MLILEWLIFRTRLGRAMRAVSHDTAVASLMGINVDAVISFTFVLGSSLAAAAGFLYAMKYPGLNQPAHCDVGAPWASRRSSRRSSAGSGT
jgi:branched-chain amino acid transport system permease protein